MNNKESLPALIIVMGVSGSGKSTVAEALAEQLDFTYLDGDDFHSAEACQHMAAGKPLTDAMRVPWVDNICSALSTYALKGTSCTLAFSGLRKAHREQLRTAPFNILFIYLTGSKETILARMKSREDHFMPTSLLDSQFESMEDSETEQDVIQIDISPSPTEIISTCLKSIKKIIL